LKEERKLRVFENRILRRIFRSKDEVTGEWRKLVNEEINDMWSSPNIFRAVQQIIMRCAGHIARMGERRGVYRVWCGSLRERDNLGDPGVDGRIILRWILWKWDVGY
jgi:hypothetical protein